MADTIDAVKNIGAKIFAGVGSGVFGLESVTDVSLLSGVESQAAMGILGVFFLMSAIQVFLSLPDDLDL